MASGSPKQTTSLKLRLLLAGGLVLIFALGLVGYALDRAFTRSTIAAVEDRLESYFYLALAALEVSEDGALQMSDGLVDPRLNQPGSGLYLRIQTDQADLQSSSTLGVALPVREALAVGESRFTRPAREDQLYIREQGIAWELYEGHTIEMNVSVFEDRAGSDREISEFRQGLWRWLGTAGILLVLANLVFMGWVLAPLQRIALDVGSVESGEATRLGGPYPSELQPLTRNVNRLLETEYANQKRYRTSLDALAHSLKTPLAVLRAALVGGNRTANSETVDSALDDMQDLVARQLERAASSARRTMARPVAVLPQVARLVNGLQKVYAADNRQCSIDIGDGTNFFGEQRDLLEMLGNVLDNAFKYGRSQVLISARQIPNDPNRPGLEIVIEDDGDGIEADELPRLLQRGVRGDERTDGHGVGLAIVSDLVESYGGTITVESSKLGGASIKLVFPPQ